ncbi:hypothetical protein B0A48_12702 [Cryoendolithus antarcticus]|uniref:Uncharacterized protein n=1 Tax=Cryoendolithus antarcticus TaxID=1507870 RepID=A0A1V8SR64_9PEZI|nr:hypothetical protein B0A48_12702 [Cryoendolithus antarcticus]
MAASDFNEGHGTLAKIEIEKNAKAWLVGVANIRRSDDACRTCHDRGGISVKGKVWWQCQVVDLVANLYSNPTAATRWTKLDDDLPSDITDALDEAIFRWIISTAGLKEGYTASPAGEEDLEGVDGAEHTSAPPKSKPAV